MAIANAPSARKGRMKRIALVVGAVVPLASLVVIAISSVLIVQKQQKSACYSRAQAEQMVFAMVADNSNNGRDKTVLDRAAVESLLACGPTRDFSDVPDLNELLNELTRQPASSEP